MRENIISDASCLILLDQIRQLEVLKFLYDEIIVTSAIAKEYSKTLPGWIAIKEPKNKDNLKTFESLVDKGEASAIALAIESENCLLILDDLQARKLAVSLGLEITGTLGILLEAKLSGYFKELKPVLDSIKSRTNFRLSQALIDKTLSKAGE